MLGVVGFLRVCYSIKEKQYEEIINPQTTEEFCLGQCNCVKFKIDEVTYIEDTIYGIVISMIAPQNKEDEFFISDGIVKFEIKEYNIVGNFSLYF